MTQRKLSNSSVISVEDENLDMLDFDSDKDLDEENDDFIETDLGTDQRANRPRPAPQIQTEVCCCCFKSIPQMPLIWI